MDALVTVIFTVFIGFVVVSIYFAPAIKAYDRGHRNRGAIFWANVLLGWTFIGWALCLVWAMSDNVDPAQALANKQAGKKASAARDPFAP
jgi:Superinfection immunity protein